MEIVKPEVEIFWDKDPTQMLKLLERAGRTCYKSEERTTDESAAPFVAARLHQDHHESIIEHEKITVRIVCDRGVTHEIVRHRLASYSQESTRYCNYGKLGIRFVRPVDFELDAYDLVLLEAIEAHYNRCLKIGRTPQQARYFLPNGLKTEIIMTCNLREWRHFFKMRVAPTAHPSMREIANMLLREMRTLVPVIFDDFKLMEE